MTSNQHSLRNLPRADTETVRALITTASDIAIVVGPDDVVSDVAISVEELVSERLSDWRGRAVMDIVTEESQPKVRSLLEDARRGEKPRWREINHPTATGEDLPVRYSATCNGIGEDGSVVLMGRDLRALASLQSRLITAQQAMEQEYERLRQMETRYRLLFQTATEAFVVVSAASNRIIEANPAAARLLGREPSELTGRPMLDEFSSSGRAELSAALAAATTSGRSETLIVANAGETRRIEVRATLFRASTDTLLLCSLRARAQSDEADDQTERSVMRLMRRMTDAVVLTDLDGSILWTNEAFLGLAEIALEEQAKGESLGRFLGRPGVDLSVMLANAQEHGRLRLFSTTMRGAYGSTAQVEISTAHLPSGAKGGFGFVIRDVSRGDVSGARRRAADPQSIEQMTELVGSVPLKELVRATTDEIERLCIETALRLTGGNRASAAEMLGLSRQSLYVKLRRFGLIDSDVDD